MPLAASSLMLLLLLITSMGPAATVAAAAAPPAAAPPPAAAATTAAADAAWVPTAAVAKIGAYDYFVDESSPVMFNGRLLMFESIVRASPQWAGHWIPAFEDCACYFRVRDMSSLAVLVNMTATCNHAFGAALVYTDATTGTDTLLVSGTPWIRENSASNDDGGSGGGKGGGGDGAHWRRKSADAGWSGPCQSGSVNCTVDLFWTSDPSLGDASWAAAVPGIRVPPTYNNDIVAVPQNSSVSLDGVVGGGGGGSHKWVMALETTAETARFAVSACPDPTNVSAWAVLDPSFTVPAMSDVGSCPSLRHDGIFFYYLTGGSNIQILRSSDLQSWTASPTHVLRHADPGDCVVAPAWFGAPTGYEPSAEAQAHMAACTGTGGTGNYGDDSDIDLVEWPQPFGAVDGAGPAVLLQCVAVRACHSFKRGGRSAGRSDEKNQPGG